uniref:Uncharacterized protein n=2 Tax=Populus trichocarpa TaxID=3694 RepID=A0A2K1YNB7_POPTR
MYEDTLVELLVGLTDCCVEADTAGVHVMQHCCTGAGRPLWRKRRRNHSCWDLGELQMLEAIVVVITISNGCCCLPQSLLDPTNKIKKGKEMTVAARGVLLNWWRCREDGGSQWRCSWLLELSSLV